MSRRLAAVLLAAVALSGCGTGLNAQTYKETGRADSTSTNLETLAVRNLHIEGPSASDVHEVGGEARLLGSLVNRGDTADTLISVTSDSAAAVTLTQDDQPASSIAVDKGRAASNWAAVLQGLSTPLRPGTYVTVTLTFTNAGRTTLQVPVHLGEGDLETREVHQEPYEH